MPRRVKVSFIKARRTPSQRGNSAPFTREPQGISPLAQYIEENRSTGIPVPELIEQFQEYDCEHPADKQDVVAAGTTYRFIRCAICHRVEKLMKPGIKE